jgi:hypothetical protein
MQGQVLNSSKDAGFAVLTAVTMEGHVIWDTTLYSSVQAITSFGRIHVSIFSVSYWFILFLKENHWEQKCWLASMPLIYTDPGSLFFILVIILPWWWRRNTLRKSRLIFTRLYGSIAQKVFFYSRGQETHNESGNRLINNGVGCFELYLTTGCEGKTFGYVLHEWLNKTPLSLGSL